MTKLLPAFLLFSFMVLIMAVVPPRTSVAINSSQPAKRSAQPQFKQCWLVLLTKGPNQSFTTQQTNGILKAHFHQVQQLTLNGNALAAGPFADKNPDLQEIFVLNAMDSLEADQLMQRDTAITTGIYSYELKRWYAMNNGQTK
ncbi:hypothetical protein MKQ68_02715 [Chitinophaga horti]|uniref:YCII-related domain-containing protein n=1 Tax=Chitinophaga horti TaxID=2920382 RepID=A0ABY6J6T1_9BACT|nr:hypothetical protein [Chitinophaga horti]UYQ94004.1 hypothetical protein MKQ68_02715 [Chitinophaga horti]